MCLIVLSWRAHPPWRLAVAANRDEDLMRPARAARFWEEAPGILAGKDLLGGGTWMGVSVQRRFAAVTNFREQLERLPGAPSRGSLVLDFLRGGASAMDHLGTLVPRAASFGGFSLFVSDGETLGYFSNRAGGPRRFEPGVYGLSNGFLDDPWPKVVRARSELDRILREKKSDRTIAALFGVLADRAPLAGDPIALDRSPIFIRGERYGTRSSTVLLVHESGELLFAERTFDANGMATGTQMYRVAGNRQ